MSTIFTLKEMQEMYPRETTNIACFECGSPRVYRFIEELEGFKAYCKAHYSERFLSDPKKEDV